MISLIAQPITGITVQKLRSLKFEWDNVSELLIDAQFFIPLSQNGRGSKVKALQTST